MIKWVVGKVMGFFLFVCVAFVGFLPLMMSGCGEVDGQQQAEQQASRILSWGRISGSRDVYRSKTPHGWLVWYSGYQAGGLAYVPDEYHVWGEDE